MKFYISSRFSYKEQVIEIQRILKQKGHEITADWTKHKDINPYSENKESAEEYIKEDLKGIENCDIFVLLNSDSQGAGKYTELGYALALFKKFGKPKIHVIKNWDANLFIFHKNIRKHRDITQFLAEF